MASENHYTTAGTVFSGFEYDMTCDKKYQTLSSTVIQNLETKTSTNYRRSVQA